ncbi:uncharacterized protein LOC128857015 [Anastrepha ludens]|uniref:uncharacterized protein LOC128857015 n=1 Tax=Anastrepha ludens TaxID=28586 RepID=UPI0023AEEBDA|nr:uncharacterized protein LOC128857015 [Anastrepha ludens]
MQGFVTEDDSALIRLIKSNEHLYDRYHKHYKLYDLRKATWEKIACELGINETICLRRWSNLRDRYARGIRRLAALAKDGIETEVPPLFKEMEFLKPHIVPRCIRIGDPSLSRPFTTLPSPFNPESFTTDLEDTKEYEEVTEPFQFMNSASNASIQEKEDEEEIDALLPTDTLSPSALYPKSPRDEPTKALHLPVTKSKNQRKSNRKRHYESDIEQELSSALKMFKQVCGAAKARHENPAIHGFGQMIVETICGMSERKQTIAMQKVTEVVMKLKIEP